MEHVKNTGNSQICSKSICYNSVRNGEKTFSETFFIPCSVGSECVRVRGRKWPTFLGSKDPWVRAQRTPFGSRDSRTHLGPGPLGSGTQGPIWVPDPFSASKSEVQKFQNEKKN